ncbi:MAG: Rrf2 family transcriptional regulator [Candidatus Cloacimonadota bacterium]|nr:Rrf2 family transcriptional regulator [Candidatus Cloacimonadota bacterium]
MKISINTDYILRAMYELASGCLDDPVSIAVISKRQKIPRKFLEQLFRRLKACGIVKAIHGKYGGYILVDKPKNITMKKIIRAAEGRVEVHNCEERRAETLCHNFEGCTFKNFWTDFNQHIASFLESYTLDNFI